MITGQLTTFGTQLMAKVTLGTATCTITSAFGGDGDTPIDATSMVNIKQPLTLGTPYTENGRKVIPVTLLMSSVGAPYTLRELCLHAAENALLPKLFKIFKFDDPIKVDNALPHTLQFLLYDEAIVSAKGVVNLHAETAVTLEMLHHKLNGLHCAPIETVNVSLAGNEIVDYIRSLPTYIDKNYVIKYSTGSSYAHLTLENRYGPGSIVVNGDHEGTGAVNARSAWSGSVNLKNCSIPITFAHMDFTATNPQAIAQVIVRDCHKLYFRYCRLANASTTANIHCYNTNISFVNSVFTYRNSGPAIGFYDGCKVIISYDPTVMTTANPLLEGTSHYYYLSCEGDSFINFTGGCTSINISAFMMNYKRSGYAIRGSTSSPMAEVRIY